MKEKLRAIPFHSFLIGLYIILFVYIRNMDEASFASTFRSIVIELIVSMVLFGAAYLIFRSGRKAGIFTTLVLVGFFVYGIIYGYLEKIYYAGHWPFSHIHRFLIVSYLFLYSILFGVIFKSKRPHFHLNYTLNVFVLVLFFMNIPVALLSLKKQNAVRRFENPFVGINSEGWGNYSFATDSLPDVYYIILDGYSSAKTLKDSYGERGPGLDQYLKQKGFYVADSSRTNYPFTAVSLSSSLNLGYLDSVLDKTTTSELIYDNFVNRAFKKAGYRIVNIESGFAVTENLSLVDKTISTKALNEFENQLLELTILRLDDLLGLSHYLRLNNELGQLKKFLPEKGPKFSFIHIVSPHPPYVADSSGKMTFRASISDMAWEPRGDYLQQLKFVSNRIEGFIDLALKSKKPPIIIIQSDHGPWIQDTVAQHVYDARTRILNAYYVPNSIRKVLYPTITPVNSFRIIFSELFKAHYPLLPDRPFPYSELKKDVTFKKYNQ